MGPKKKGAKADDPERLAAEQAAAALRQLQLQCKRLKLQCEMEEKLYNQYLQEREKLNYFWIVEKKTLSEKEAELRNKERELQDLDERQQIELKIFQQRLKHLRFDLLDSETGQKVEGELANMQQLQQQSEKEAAFREDLREMKVMMRDNESAEEHYVRCVKLDQDKKTLELRREFDRKARDLQQRYGLKMKTVRDDMERSRKKEIASIESSKNAHIQRIMLKNMQEFQDIKVYFGDITTSNFDLIKRLKEEHAELKKRESGDAKQMFDLKQKNMQLSEPLKKAHQDVQKLQEELKTFESDQKRLSQVKAKLRDQEKALSKIVLQEDISIEQLAAAEKEKNELFEAFQNCVLEVQEKSGLKNLLLEKKVETIEESLEASEAQLSELLVSANLEVATQSGISEKLDQIISYKNDIIRELHEEVNKIKGAHKQMIGTYEAKLAEYGIPRQELGFEPTQMLD